MLLQNPIFCPYISPKHLELQQMNTVVQSVVVLFCDAWPNGSNELMSPQMLAFFHPWSTLLMVSV